MQKGKKEQPNLNLSRLHSLINSEMHNDSRLVKQLEWSRKLWNEFKYKEAVCSLNVLLRGVKNRAGQVLAVYLLQKEIGEQQQRLSFNNHSIKNLLKAQHLLAHLINLTIPPDSPIQTILMETQKIQSFNSVYKVLERKREDKNKEQPIYLNGIDKHIIIKQMQALGMDMVSQLAQLHSRIGLNFYYFGDLVISSILIKEVKRYLEITTRHHTEEYAATLEIMANYYRFRYEEKQATQFMKTSLAIRSQLFGDDSEETAQSKHSLALLFMELRRLPRALIAVEEAVQLRRAYWGEVHPKVSESLYLKAEVLLKNNQVSSSQLALEQALSINDRTIGNEYIQTAHCQSLLAQIYARHKQERLFIQCFDKAHEVFSIYYGNMNSALAQLFNHQGLAFSSVGKQESAKEYLEKTVSIY